MSTTQQPSTTSDPRQLAALARSILSCPTSVDLVVDGFDTVVEAEEGLGMQDLDGSPTFSCRPESALARAAAGRRSALITVSSGVGAAGSPARRDSLTLAGTLVVRRREECECCTEVRDVVSLELSFVLLDRASEQQFRVPLDHFRSPAHHLNRGYLQRSVEHANDSHQDELRRAVATMSGTRMAEIVGVRLSGLSPRGVSVQWVCPDGAHESELRFPRPARTTAELGAMLRRELHAGLC